MLSREEIQQAADLVAVQYSKEQAIAIRDIVVKDRSVSLTIVGVKEGSMPALEAALRQRLAEAGAETVHFRFRAGEAAPIGAANSAQGASGPAAQTDSARPRQRPHTRSRGRP